MTKTEIITYIGTYTRRESFVDGKAEGIYIYHLDPETGRLAYAATVTGDGTLNPSFVTLGPDGRTLYVVNEIYGHEGPNGTVSAFAVDPATGGLRYLNQQSTHGLAPCYVRVEPEGRYCLVANYMTGNLCVLPIRADGRLDEASDVVQFSGSGPNPDRQEGPHAHMVLSDPDGGHILAVDLGTDRLMAFRLDRERGALLPAEPPWTQLPPGTGPRHLAFHPRLPFAYVISELQSTIIAGRYCDGTFEPIQTMSTQPADYAGQNSGAEIKVAPSGRFVYASNRGHNSIAIFAVDQSTGRLSLVSHEPTQGVGPRDFTIDPAGNLLLVANQDTDTIVTFRIDPATGSLHATGHIAHVPTPVCLHLA